MAALLGLVIKFLVLVLLAIAWEFLKDLPLFRPSTGRFGPGDLPDLKRTYGSWERFATAPILLMIAGWSWLAYEGFTAYVDYHYARIPRPQFLITLPHLAWLAPAFGVGLVGAAIACDLMLRWLLGDRYPDYHAYIDLKHGYNVRRASGIAVWVFVAAGIVLLPQMLRTHTAFYQDHMVVRRFLSLTDQRIDYKQIVALNQVEQKKAPNGDWKNRPHHAITFADGTHWRSNALVTPDPMEDARLFTFLGEATGLEVGRRRRLE